MSETLTVTEAKSRLSELVAAAAARQEHVEIARHGKPAAVLVSYVEMAALRETIAILSDARAVEDIAEAGADVRTGRICDAEALREAILARRPGVTDRWTVQLTCCAIT